MADRRYDRNTGYLNMPDIPDDKWVAGIVVILMDDDSKYSTEFRAESLDKVPGPELQETLGQMLAGAWELANTPGMESI